MSFGYSGYLGDSFPRCFWFFVCLFEWTIFHIFFEKPAHSIMSQINKNKVTVMILHIVDSFILFFQSFPSSWTTWHAALAPWHKHHTCPDLIHTCTIHVQSTAPWKSTPNLQLDMILLYSLFLNTCCILYKMGIPTGRSISLVSLKMLSLVPQQTQDP